MVVRPLFGAIVHARMQSYSLLPIQCFLHISRLSVASLLRDSPGETFRRQTSGVGAFTKVPSAVEARQRIRL